MEFATECYCPHCGEEQATVAYFNESKLGPTGGNSNLMHETCGECDKEFYFKATLGFEIDVYDTFKAKPKAKP